MGKFTLGLVSSGEEYAEMGIVSLYSLFLNGKFQLQTGPLPLINEIDQIIIVADDLENRLVRFARFVHGNVRVIEPSAWEEFGLPPMSNGSFATYWKFDLLQNLQPNEVMIYLDSDAFIVDDLQIEFLSTRMELMENSENALLMVPSHRPVLERLGYGDSSNPYAYFNAGFFIIRLNHFFEINSIIQHYKKFYHKSIGSLIWHDQDLLNSYFGKAIRSLPLRYNISSGMLYKEYFRMTQINYLGIREFENPILIHASGGILKKKQYYPYSDRIEKIVQSALTSHLIPEEFLFEFRKFGKQISKSRSHYLRRFLGLTKYCSPHVYHDNFYWRSCLNRQKLRTLFGLRAP